MRAWGIQVDHSHSPGECRPVYGEEQRVLPTPVVFEHLVRDFLGDICFGRTIRDREWLNLSLVVSVQNEISSRTLVILKVCSDARVRCLDRRPLALCRRGFVDGRCRIVKGYSPSLVHTYVCFPFDLATALSRALRESGFARWRRSWHLLFIMGSSLGAD